MGPGITWYEILGVLPGASAEKIEREYDARRSLLRPELISGAPSNVVTAITRAEGILDAGRLSLHVTAVRLTQRPMPVDGLVVDQSPRAPAKMRRGGELTVKVWHPPARSR